MHTELSGVPLFIGIVIRILNRINGNLFPIIKVIGVTGYFICYEVYVAFCFQLIRAVHPKIPYNLLILSDILYCPPIAEESSPK